MPQAKAPPTPPTSASAATPAVTREPLAFLIQDGLTENRFYRGGHVAAHALARGGAMPRLIVAFPAGDMGGALWFERTDGATAPVSLTMGKELVPVERDDGMRGVELELHAPAGTGALRVKKLALASVRVVRDVEQDRSVAAELAPKVQAEAAKGTVTLARTTLDGRHHLEMLLEPLAGGALVHLDAKNAIVVEPPKAGAAIALKVRVLADDAPLTPLSLEELLTAGAGADPRSREVLEFLSYREKICAGSWHYLTYFGRDTLLTARLLMPVLQPEAMESALGSVVDRLSAEGAVAHEEEVGEFAVQKNLAATPRPADTSAPRFDYKMVDDDFLLSAILADWNATPAARGREAAFMARKTPDGRTYADALRANFARVLHRAEPFAARPGPTTLVSIEPGHHAGNWRDSRTGLGHGRYPYDVNAALVPAALAAVATLTAPDGPLADAATHERANALGAAWAHAERYFHVEVPVAEARARMTAYAKELALDPKETAALAARIDRPVVVDALALDANGAPLPVMNSDDGFVMLFGKPEAAMLERMAERIERPFPLGLRTPVGVVVANAAFAGDAKLRALFTPLDYHGTVVWSWVQAMLAVGLRRQLGRDDLPAPTRAALDRAEKALWDVIDATAAGATAELWTFHVDGGRYVKEPFGQHEAHAEESNAAQLWSTVYLAVHR